MNVKRLIVSIGAAFLVVLGFVYLFQNMKDSDELSPAEAGDLVKEYINDNFFNGLSSLSVISVAEESGVYGIVLKLEGEEFKTYATRDGKFLFIETIDMETSIAPAAQQNQGSIEAPENMADFIDCLKRENFEIYGADWCPYCNELVAMLGGYDVVNPIYTECTEEKDLCDRKNITGYPTILLGGERYQGARTIADFSLITGCEI